MCLLNFHGVGVYRTNHSLTDVAIVEFDWQETERERDEFERKCANDN